MIEPKFKAVHGWAQALVTLAMLRAIEFFIVSGYRPSGQDYTPDLEEMLLDDNYCVIAGTRHLRDEYHQALLILPQGKLTYEPREVAHVITLCDTFHQIDYIQSGPEGI